MLFSVNFLVFKGTSYLFNKLDAIIQFKGFLSIRSRIFTFNLRHPMKSTRLHRVVSKDLLLLVTC